MNIHSSDTDFADITSRFLMGPDGRTELAQADFALVFGNPHIIEELAEAAADHYHRGYFDLVVVSGCGNWAHEYQRAAAIQTPECIEGLNKTEATRIFEALIDRDVPASAVLLDHNATNTQQNVENAKRLLETAQPDVSTCIGFGHVKAGTRYIETLARRWPDMFAMGVNVNPYVKDIENWHECDDFSRDVLTQVAKRETYLHQGDLVAVDLDVISEVARQMQRPQSALQDDCTFIM